MTYLEDHAYLAPFDSSFTSAAATAHPPANVADKDDLEKRLKKLSKRLDEQQRMLYAQDRYAVLLVFQALDAAGKDGTIRAVFNRIDPNGVNVTSFKAPSALEREHDFLWRTAKALPSKGQIGVFNRSYYEEVLVVRVHPEYLKGQRLPAHNNLDELWAQRFESIRDHERHLARQGTVIIKFWLKHSKEEQRQRFLSRLTEPEKHWKFSAGDVKERGHWDAYMEAFEHAINATSVAHAPWYVIPADNKAFMRVQVAEVVSQTLKQLDLHYPEQDAERLEHLQAMKAMLESE